MSSRGSHEVHSDEEDGSKSQELHLQPAFRSGSSMQLTVQRNLHNPTDDAEASEEEGDWKENELGQIENCCKKNIKKKELRGTVLSDHRINVEDHHLTVASDYAEGQPADSKSWNQERNSKKKTPCSSGEFTFKGFRKKKAKYVRTSNNTSPEVLYEMMIDQFQLRVPNLLISVTGGARNFSMNPRLRDLFGKGLVKAAQSTEAWIITGGCHAGVMKLVGEAVQDFSMTSSSYKIVTIGIATWGIVYNSARMVRKAGVLPAEYSLDVENIDGLPCLDNNHSHFILVDDGTLGSCGGEIPLRTDLERFISEQTVKGEGFQRLRSSRPGHVRASRKERKSRGFQRLRCPQPSHDTASREERDGMGDGMKIPIMCLVLEGDPDSLDTIHRSMINNTPCVIVEGSGGVADVIAQVADMNPSKITIALIKEKLSHFSQETIGEKQIIEWTKKIQDIVRMSRLLTIFRYDKDGAQDMDVAMLHALMKASQSMDHMGNENWAYQLKLAVLWNHMDIAKSDIFNSAWSWKPEDLYPALTVALIENRPNFVQLFLDQGVSLQDYVTEKTLIQLYNNIETTFVFHQKLEKIMFKQTKKHKNENEEGVNLDHIEKALKSMLGKFPKLVDSTPEPTAPQTAVNIQSQGIHDTNGQRPSKVKYPIRVLLIWAVMQNRGKLAEILWTQCQDCIVGALACSKILRTLSKEEKDTNNKTAMKALADRFEERASGVFSECCRKNKVRAEQLLTRKSLGWGDTTCMELATNAKAMSFMSNGGVQTFLTKIWWGKLSVDNSLKRLLFCMVFFPLISTGFITFRSKKSGTRSTWQHLCAFVTAPVVIFYYNVASYIGFLWLFAYVLMMDFQNNPSRNEYLLYIWSFSLVCEEVRQVLYDHEDMRFVTKVRMYITEFWNQMDVVAIGLFIAGLAVRCIAHSPYVGRVILAVDFIVFCLRLMHIFTLSKVLGPKIIMMQRMTMDIFFFLFLLAVWIVSFGVSKQAILVHNEQRLDWIFRSVIYQPYLILFGQLPTDVDKTHFLNDTECTSDGSDADKPKCAEILDGYLMFPGGLTIVLQCLYLLFANILLLNLLIAMFSHTFSKVQENTDQIWKFQRYKLIKEYSNRPPAPPPFILLNLLMSLATKVVRVVSRKLDHDEKRCKHELDDYETRGLLSWEKYMKEDYLLNQREVQNQSSDMKTRATSKKVDALAKLLESEQKRARAMEQQVFLSLSWIMKSLTEKGSASEEKAPVMVHQKSIEAEEPTTGDSLMSSKCEYHVNSRQLMYPNSNVQRFPVPDELVPWQVDFPLYDPPSYVAKIERQETYNPWIESTGFQPKREYTEKDRLLLNPEGRTGIKGLGSQMWYGPNHCLHPVLTRWKRTDNGSFVWKDKKKVLEVLAVKREGSERWVLPGGRLRPDEKLPSTLKDILKEEFWETFEALLENGTEVYKGYLDDPRNTDNAWVEIHTVNVHLESPEDLDLLELNLHILESADSIRWQMVDEKILLYANMKDILQQVARKLDAHY